MSHLISAVVVTDFLATQPIKDVCKLVIPTYGMLDFIKCLTVYALDNIML